MAAIAVVVNGGNNGIDLTALMAALLTVTAVDGGGNNGIFTTRYFDSDRRPCRHCPCPRSLLDNDRTAG